MAMNSRPKTNSNTVSSANVLNGGSATAMRPVAITLRRNTIQRLTPSTLSMESLITLGEAMSSHPRTTSWVNSGAN